MPLQERPKAPPGSYPGKGMVDAEPPLGLRVGIITRVDEVNMKADVRVITGGGYRYEIDLTQGMAGPRSFWGGVPEVNSLVVLGYRSKHKQLQEAVILGYLPIGNKSGLRFDPFAPDDPSKVDPADASIYERAVGKTVRYKRLKLRPGDVGGMSADGAELALARDVRMCNRAGDLIELRDAERTLVTQAVHSFSSVSGLKHASGPIRRGAFFLPGDIFKSNADGTQSRTLLTDKDGYFGTDNLQELGPGVPGASTKYANSSGVVLDLFNDTTNFPPVTYTNGRRVFYPATVNAVNFELGEASGGADAYIEDRTEIAHQTNAAQDVLEEIDGFTMSRSKAYIERVLGTLVGNDPLSTTGMRQYGRVLRPRLFSDWSQTSAGEFKLEEVERGPLDEDKGVRTEAGAYLFRVYCPDSDSEDNPFALAVSKQGKIFLHAPGSRVERYPAAKNISAEVNLEGALKMFIGAEASTRTSIHLTTAGGIEADLGRNATGQAIKVRYHCSVASEYTGNNDDDDVSKSESINGNARKSVSGDDVETVAGSKHMVVNGMLAINADRMNVNAHSGYSLNISEYNAMVSGKSQYNYGLVVLENIFAGGKVSTILAGGSIQTVLAGAYTISVAAGAVAITAGAGAVAVSAGAALALTAGAALTATAGAAVSVTAGAALTMTAGLAVTVTSAVLCSLAAPQVLLGGPPAVLGVVRGVPTYPPGVPTLDYITGAPLLGSALVRSL